MEMVSAFGVAMLCAVLGFFGLQIISGARDRSLLTRLFFFAFGLRFVFTLLFYALGADHLLGGADDTGWGGAWARSRVWVATEPDSFWTLYNPAAIQANQGFRYISTIFYYIIDTQSQIALATFNCFIGSMVVIVIYQIARNYYSEKSSLFAASVAAVMPSFLVWSALTVKETWLIFFEIATLYAVLKMRDPKGIFVFIVNTAFAITLVALTLTFRFYVSWFLIGGIVISIFSYKSKRPVASALVSFVGITALYVALNQTHILQFDLLSFFESSSEQINTFRTNISDIHQMGNNSAVRLDYDPSTPGGAAMMALVGGTYLLLAPFPWQIIQSPRQLATLPDVLLWWYLLIVFIIPGIRHAWKNQQALLISVFSFVVPLFLFYSMMFGNVGLAYRQRAQLVPFLLILVAAGHERRYGKRSIDIEKKKKMQTALARLIIESQTTPQQL